MTFSMLLLGFGVGLLVIVPPGPLSVTLLEIGVTQGRSAGVRSGAGIAAGDMVTGTLAATIVVAGGILPDAMFAGVRVASATILIGLGLVLLVRPTTVEAVAGALQRPARALFLMTVLTPTVLGAWIAMLAALPFSQDPGQVAMFVVGVCVASTLWHTALGSLAAEFGHLLRGATARIARAGGLTMIGFGIAGIAG
ncbi:MAG: LysE family transporter [Actinomycetota bacterium]